MKKLLFFIMLALNFHCSNGWASETLRRVVDPDLNCIVYYDKNNSVVKILIRDPGTKVETIMANQAFVIPIQSLIMDLLNIYRYEKDQTSGNNGIRVFSNDCFIYDRADKTFIFKNKKFSLLEKPMTLIFNKGEQRTGDKNNPIIDALRYYYNELASWKPDHFQKKMDTQINNYLNDGVNLALLQKYYPYDGDYFILTPEEKMSQIIGEIVHSIIANFKQDNSGSPQKIADEFFKAIHSYHSKEIGKKGLGEEMKMVNFPLASCILSNVFEQLALTNDPGKKIFLQDVALMIAAKLDVNQKYRNEKNDANIIEIDGVMISKVLVERIPSFLDASDLYSTLANKLMDDFFKQYPENLKDKLNEYNVSYPYYFANYFLKDFDLEQNRKLAIDFLKMIQPKNSVVFKEAKNYLAKLQSYEVHQSFKTACSFKDKCCILKDYLHQIDQSQREHFPQDLIDGNIGALAMGDGFLFDFPIDTKDQETCIHLLFFLGKQQKQFNPTLDAIEIPVEENCSIVDDMSNLLTNISILGEKLQPNHQ